MTQSRTSILSIDQIKECLPRVELIPIIEEGFKAFSQGKVVVPPVGEMIFDDPPGDTHIKYGYVKQQEYFTIKIASGFYNNPQLGLKASQGVVLLFSQKTGELKCVLLDEGLLTDIRTTIASMITLKYLSPSNTKKIGIIGTGIQARLQLEYLSQVSDVKEIVIWGRNIDKMKDFEAQFKHSNFTIHAAASTRELAQQCQTIITTTASKSPLLTADDLLPGTHITALGSDTSEKIELETSIINGADLVVSDSIAQSKSRGEVYRARAAGRLEETKLIELGSLIANPSIGRTNDQQTTIADLTGVAVQDIMIATAIYNCHMSQL